MNYQKDNWASPLALAKFVYIATIHSLTSNVPFKIIYKELPKSDILTFDKFNKYITNLKS